MCDHIHDILMYSKFHRNPFTGFGARGVEIYPIPLLWLLAFTTACTTIQAVIIIIITTTTTGTRRVCR